MSEVLSQSEIDALLSALQSGEVDVEAIREEQNTKKIRVYDFRRPNKFSKDQLNTIEVIYDNFCRLLTTLLSGSLRTRVMVKVASVEQVTYEEFTRSIPNPTILNIFSLAPLEGKAILEINPVIGFSIIDRLFGGPGFSTIKGRPLTEIEKTVMERIVEKILSLFTETWASLIHVDAFLENIEINPQFTQIVSPLEMVVIITLNTQIGETEGLINICLPCLMLETLSGKLNTKFWFTTNIKAQHQDSSKFIQKVVEKARIPLTAVLGKTSLTVKELLELQVGDVIDLERKKDSEIEIYAGSRLKFYGKPGLLGSKLAVQISRIQQEGSEDNE
ncbi:flagellar motor switch protein FliM [Thermanaerosceptrum fracticalcis]|uniref:Flagellar motor switch protein FliM n=1 Tax=Thermanaerosceptrum fracticalcis TaxID=1712410 RepID=A0A7G6E106_THEFR|nr:flagellar motor switch protein FliM [Thermanaerosceptrum fracticalcis]QNB45760.1 flagellar motor switch protein FliM [Thermanaerosceptrum fracticalcis]